MTKVSVVLPVYNVEVYLRQCLDSLINQSLNDIEIICVNDGSTDESLGILNEYSAKDPRIIVISESNSGPAVARNEGFKHCIGEYTFFMDSDDFIEYNMLESMYYAAKMSRADIVLCRSYEMDINTNKRVKSKWTLKLDYLPDKNVFNYESLGDQLFQFSMGWTWDKLYSTDLIKKSGLKFPLFRNSEDLIMAYGLLIYANSMVVLDHEYVTHRINDTNSVSNSRKKYPFEFIKSSLMLKKILVENGIYSHNLEKSYVNWAIEYAIWNSSTLPYWTRCRTLRQIKKIELPEIIKNSYDEQYYHQNTYFQFVKWLLNTNSLCIYIHEFFKCNIFKKISTFGARK